MVGRSCDAKNASNPCDANRNRTTEWETTTTQAAIGDKGKRSPPTVIMTRLEYVMTPTAMAKAPTRNNCCTEEIVNRSPTVKSVNGEDETNTPMTLAILFAPRE